MNKLRVSIRNTEINWIANAIIRQYNSNEALKTDIFLSSVMSEVQSLYDNLTTAILQDKKLSMLAKIDAKRNERLQTLSKLIDAYLVFPDEEKNIAAAPLKAIYAKYSKVKITKENYVSKSSLIESLLEDMADETIRQNIAKLDGISVQLDKIREAQTEFVNARDDNYTAKTVAATTYKRKLLEVINTKLVPYLTAMSVAKNDVSSEFAHSVETEINNINDILVRRIKKLPAVEELEKLQVNESQPDAEAMPASQADPE